jgi:phospholipid/cholesterol/gamma-HCH transport system substrate-binding protein|uniref:Mce/MlaD domain-containing protein n=1 Tax=Kumanoa mahlacensis TaxID=1196387 RepID=A0A8K1YUA1_9FLOR|nr:Hypothetical protein Ycf22 [Kumanoa mahlacensis]
MKTNFQNIVFKNKTLYLLIFIFLASLLIKFVPQIVSDSSSYSIFIEFDNAHGIKPGTVLRLRGVNIGQVIDLKLNVNTVLVLVKVRSSLHVIPKKVLVETNQTGLLNEAVIDILPLEVLDTKETSLLNPLSSRCINSTIICNLSYLQGDRGLNYDDLIRATTRISQRFDDPRFFNTFYVFLQNSIELSDKVLEISSQLLDTLLFVFYKYPKSF